MKRNAKITRRPSYAEAIEIVAANDEPLDLDPESVSGLASVLLIAWLWGAEPVDVARDVVAFREAEEGGR